MLPTPRFRSWSGCVAVLALSCAGSEDQAGPPEALRTWTYDSAMVFPRDRSLVRPEDGVALPDGRLLVVDQVSGLRLIEPDGASRPFGDLAAAGYRHRPPDHSGGANGISLEPNGTHALVADIFGGAIYRVSVATGAAEKIYQHRYGINTAIRDSHGAIWFTQSARNTPEEGEARMWTAVDIPKPEGALYRIAMQNDRPVGEAKLLVDSLFFANGIALDERAGRLYLAETVGGRVWRFRVDAGTGTLSEGTVVVDSTAVDNLEFDEAGRLWMAVPLTNEVQVFDPASGTRQTVFRAHTEEQERVLAEFTRRGQAGQSRMDLFTPAVWAPLPGPVTGLILSPNGGPIYLTGLGNALIRLPR